MRILVLSDGWPPYARGGAETVAAGLADAYAASGHEVWVATTVRSASERQAIESASAEITLRAVPTRYPKLLRPYLGIRNPAATAAFAAILGECRPDVVHAHNVHRYLGYHSLRLCHEAGKPVILTAHDAMSVDYGRFTQGYAPLQQDADPPVDYRVRVLPTLRKYHVQYFALRNALIRRHLRRYVSGLYTVSDALRCLLTTNGIGVDGVVHTGIDPVDFDRRARPATTIRERFGLAQRSIITYSGRLTIDKGCMQALAMMAALRESEHRPTLLLLGAVRGECPDFDRAVEESGLRDTIVYAGWQSGEILAQAYHESDVIIVPSICLDAFPTVVLDAMACATPVVATCFGGAREALVDGETGFVANPFDTRAFVEQIERLLSDADLRRSMGEEGRRRLLDRFTARHCARIYLALMKDLRKSRPLAGRTP